MKKPVFIGIAGSSGSGKTTAAWKLKTSSKDVEHVRLDNYLKHPRTFPWKNGFKNWESPSNIKFNLLLRHLKLLSKGKKVATKIPAAISKHKDSTLIIRPKKIILVEGFVLFTDKKVRDFFDVRVFFDLPLRLIPKRRKRRSKEYYDQEYDRSVTIPEYLKYGLKQRKYGHYIIDASLPKNIIYKKLKKIVELDTKKS
jgi:uridine kinase